MSLRNFFKTGNAERARGALSTSEREEALEILAKTAKEMRPWLTVADKRYNPTSRAFELVLKSGMIAEKASLPEETVYGWLEEGDRTKEAEIRAIVMRVADRMDLQETNRDDPPGLFDWREDI